jgi:HlyD family secretion protein
VIATLDPAAPRLPGGAVAEVRYEVLVASGALLPSSALSAEGGRTFVFRVDTDESRSVARRTEVRVVGESGNQAVVAAVDAGALPLGTRVVAPRPLDVRDNTRVRVIEVVTGP